MLILVDENDNAIGQGDKLSVHKNALLHRAFSVFIFNSKNEWLLQKRAKSKYHSSGLWSNTCCSHPGTDEILEEAARHRLHQEMGFSCDLRKVHAFTYKIQFANGLTEHEYDHILFGFFNHDPVPEPNEVEDWVWMSFDDLYHWLLQTPQDFTYWFNLAFPKIAALRGQHPNAP